MTVSRAQSDFLNHARWIAAWLVVAEHARSLLMRDYGQLEQPGGLAKGFYFLTGFGHEAVMVFFVISGFLVGGKVWERTSAGSFGWRSYLCDRASRLYAVLVVALLAGWALDACGYHWFHASGLYDRTMPEPVAVISRSVVEELDWRTFAGNLAFTQTILVNPFGSNGPLWSLANECWYYLLFPACLGVICGRGAGRWIGALTTAGMLWFLPTPMLALFGVWLLGAGCASLSKPLLPWWVCLAAFAAAFALARVEYLKFPHLDQYLIGITFALLLNSFAGLGYGLPAAGPGRVLADFSYTTYLLHFPWLVFVASAIQVCSGRTLRLPFRLESVGIFAICVGSALLLSWLVSLPTEARTKTYREWLYRLARVKHHAGGRSAG